MSTDFENETWVIEEGDRIIQKEARTGAGSLTPWEQLPGVCPDVRLVMGCGHRSFSQSKPAPLSASDARRSAGLLGVEFHGPETKDQP
jgi:hypothetical protein